jgi:Arc-like DNA binding domain
MGRPPLEKKQQQFTVALPPEVRSRLEAAAKAAGHSVAEEIRKRIDQTISREKLDPTTVELLRGIENLAARLREDFGVEWFLDTRIHHAFSVAVAERLMAYKPASVEPRAIKIKKTGMGFVELPEFDSPESLVLIGRMRERDDRRLTPYLILQQRIKRSISESKRASKKEPKDE